MVKNHIQTDHCTGQVSVTFHPSSQGFYLSVGFSIYEMCCTNQSAHDWITSLRFAGLYVDMNAITIMTRHMVSGLRPVSSGQVDKQSQSRLYTFQRKRGLGTILANAKTTYFIHISAKNVTQSHIPLAKLMLMSIFNGLPQTQAF